MWLHWKSGVAIHNQAILKTIVGGREWSINKQQWPKEIIKITSYNHSAGERPVYPGLYHKKTVTCFQQKPESRFIFLNYYYYYLKILFYLF